MKIALPMSNREQFDWDHRIKYLLKDSFQPKTFENYRRTVGRGLERARHYVELKAQPVPAVETIKAIHKAAFGEAYTNAGAFRQYGQEIAIGRDDARGAYYSQIPDELNLLSKQASELFSEATTVPLKARAITFYHLRYVKIHPFMDGNGRTGRVIFENQAKRLLEMDRRIDFSHDEYIGGIQKAFSTGDLSRLTKTMTGIDLSPEIAKSPFPLKLQEIVITKSIPGGGTLRIPCGEDVETAQEVEIASLSPRLVKAISQGKRVPLELHESTSRAKAMIDIDMSKVKKLGLGRGIGR